MTRPAVVTIALVLANAHGSASDVIEIGSRRELFVDRLLIDRMDGAELRLHHPMKAPRADSPLPVGHYITILKDEDKDGPLFRAYWRGHDPSFRGEKHTGHAGETVEYAESRDGHEWSFPALGLHKVGGTRENNVLLADMPPLLTNFSPFVDTRPGVPAAERYKALCGYPGSGDKRGKAEHGMGLFAFTSADGIHWTRGDEVIPYQPEWRHAFDSQNVSFWSSAEQQYICYFRTWTDPDRLRSISRTTSRDFQTWTKPVAMNPNLPGEHLYTNQTHPYFRAPHLYIALPTRFVTGRGHGPAPEQTQSNTTDILLMSTRAGSEKYDRTFSEAFIRPGLDRARWTNRANYVAQNVVATSPTEMSIYHRSGDRYVLRHDGFVSVHAAAAPGTLLTKPIRFSGGRLEANFSTSAAGSLQVEILSPDGAPIAGFAQDDCPSMYGDQIDRVVRWRGGQSLAGLAGQPVRLRFVLRECDLYSFQFPPSVHRDEP